MMEAYNTRVDYVHEMPTVAKVRVTEPIQLVGKVAVGSGGASLDGRANKSFMAVNKLFNKGVAVKRVDKAQAGLRPGDFLIPSAQAAVLEPIAKETGMDFRAVNTTVTSGVHDIKRQRIGLYQRYGGGNMEEGWTRFIFEDFDFPYTTVMEGVIKAGDLNSKFDVIILPSDATATLTGEPAAGGRGGEGGGASAPPEFRNNGFGKEGIAALRSFVQAGGTLVTVEGSTAFAIDRLGVGVRNTISASVPTKEFWCPGSHLRVKVDNTQPIAYGMPAEALVLHSQGSPAYEVTAANSPGIKTVAKYLDRDILESGWLIGEDYLTKKGAVITSTLGKGTIVLVGVPCPHRAQNQMNWKFLFNALVPMN